MRKRKHRLCTSLLCSVLILSNVASVGTPVYAKSLGTDSNIVTAASDEAMPSTSDDGSGSVPAGSSEANPGSDLTDAAPGADDVTQTPADPETEDPGKTADPADTGDTDQAGDPSTPDNPADTDDPGKTEGPSSSDNPADADDSDKTEDPGASDNPADPENPGNSEEESGADDPAGSGDEASVSDNDISDEEQSEEGNLYTDQSADTSISIKDITVEEIGYQKAQISWTVDNPNNELISDLKLVWTNGESGEAEQKSSTGARPSLDNNYQEIPGKYYARTDDMEWAKEAKVAFTTYLGDGTATLIESEPVTLSPRDINEANISLTTKAGTTSFTAYVELSPCYTVDSGILFNLYYWPKDSSPESAFSVDASMGISEDKAAESVTISLADLSESKEYEYYIEPAGRLGTRSFAALGSKENPLSFTTKQIVTYEDSEFPDDVFRSYLKNKIRISEDTKITSDKLDSIVNINDFARYQISSSSNEVQSLKGIEHLENLTSIDMQGHGIKEGAEGISKLTGLTSINLSNNDLTSLPDLSRLTHLSYVNFNYNLIDPAEITNSKLPASYLSTYASWCSDTIARQRGEVTLKTAPEYFKSGETWPFLAQITGLKRDPNRRYTLSLTIDGQKVSKSLLSYNTYDMYYIKDIQQAVLDTDTGITVNEGTPYTATITMTDNYSREWLNETAEISFAPANNGIPQAKTAYIRANAQDARISIVNLPTTYNSETVSRVELQDKDGNAVGSASVSELYFSSDTYNAYEDVFGYFSLNDFDRIQTQSLSGTVYFAKYLSAGDYSAVVTINGSDGETSSAFENAVHVDNTAVLEDISQASSDLYDNYGHYLYVTVRGANIDPSKVRPVFYDGDTILTKYVSSTVHYNRESATYKLEKLNENPYWDRSGDLSYSFRFERDNGYNYINVMKKTHLTLNSLYDSHDFVTFEHYNYKKEQYEVRTDSTVKDGTSVTVTVYSGAAYDSNRKELAKATAEVKNSMLSLMFETVGTAEKESYAPPRNREAYFTYNYKDSNDKERTFNHNNYVEWYNYHSGSTSTGKTAYTDTIVYQETLMSKLSVGLYVPAEKVTADQDVTVRINGTSATLKKDSGAPSGYAKYTGTWTSSDSGLGEGIYRIEYVQGDATLYTQTLYVYDDSKFYTNSQWLGTWTDKSGKSGILVEFSSEQLSGNYIHKYDNKVSNADALNYWKSNGYQLEIFDRLGRRIDGWSVFDANWSNNYFTLRLNGLSQEYVGYYARITRNNKPGIQLSSGKVYYTTAYNANETFGAWSTIGGSNVWFNDSAECNAYYGVGSYSYPVTVTITRPYDTDVIKEFTVNKPANNSTFYYFTQADLSGIDSKEVYCITGTCPDGSAGTNIGYLGVRGNQSTVVHVSGITLNKSTLNLQLEESGDLIATVKPDNATNKNVEWNSDNPAVATVNAQGKVTAIAAGTAKITVTTADNNKTATCTVNVFNYTLDQSKLEFDLTTEEGSKPKQLHVKNGNEIVTSNITWSSSDDSVAAVAKDGTVTPVDAGTAQILATVKNGPTLSCAVTVSNNKLTAAALSESSCELYVDKNAVPQKPNTKSLKLYYSPSTADVEAVWASSDDAVVSVEKDPKDQTKAVITAKSKGTATITATVKTASDTKTCKCEVTVKAVTSAADAEKALPQGLTALTNEKLTLSEVSLDDFPGWEWLEEEKLVALAQFAGMQQKSFAATYTDPATPDAEPYERAIPVTLSTVTGIGIQTESSTVQKDSNAELFINWIMSGTQPDDMSEHVKKVVWSSDKPAVADVTTDATDADGKATLTAKAAGKATVKAQITFRNNKTYKAQYKITVVEGTPADIQVSEVSGFTADPSMPGTYQGKLGSDAADNNRTIFAAVTGATSLTAKSNNANVAAVGKATATEEGTYTIPLTLKAAGMAKITLTANDTAKTQKDIFLYVTDSRPIISEDPVTVNLQQTDGTAFMIYSGDGYEVTTASLSVESAAKFALTSDAETPGRYLLKAIANTDTGSYKLSLNVQVKSLADPDAAVETFDNVALNVKVIDQKPKYKIKQSTKFNLFYKDWESRLEITTDEVLDSAELTDCDFTLIRNENSDYTITAKQPESLTSNCDKAGTLTLTFAGYNPVYTSFTVSTEYKKPKITLAAKSATLYPNAGINSVLIRLKDGKEDYSLTDHPTATPVIVGTEATNLFNLTKDGDSLLLTARSSELPGSTNVTINLQETNWAEAVKLTYTVKTNKGKPSVKLGKAALQLNTNPSAASYDMAATEIMWKDGAAFDASRVSVSATDNKAKALLNKEITFRFDETKNQIIAKLNKTDPDAVIKTGSYKFKVNAIKETGETTLTASAPLTVKIVNVAIVSGQKSKAIAISSKGSIDVLNREGTSVTVTAALKSLNGTVTGARLSGSAAHLFDIDTEAPIKDNKVVIRAKSGVSLITKYAYKVKLNLTIENAEGDEFYYLTPDISLKLKQGKPKVTVAPKTATFFSGSYNNAITRKLTVSLKGAEAPAVERVELVNDFDGAFDKDNINYDGQNGTFTLSSTEKALKGKSYNLQLKVTFKDQADNEKPTVVKYSVKIK